MTDANEGKNTIIVTSESKTESTKERESMKPVPTSNHCQLSVHLKQ